MVDCGLEVIFQDLQNVWLGPLRLHAALSKLHLWWLLRNSLYIMFQNRIQIISFIEYTAILVLLHHHTEPFIALLLSLSEGNLGIFQFTFSSDLVFGLSQTYKLCSYCHPASLYISAVIARLCVFRIYR